VRFADIGGARSPLRRRFGIMHAPCGSRRCLAGMAYGAIAIRTGRIGKRWRPTQTNALIAGACCYSISGSSGDTGAI